MKTNNEPVEISRTEIFTYGFGKRDEYFLLSWKGNYSEEAFSYEEICAIHELTGQIIKAHKEKEVIYD